MVRYEAYTHTYVRTYVNDVHIHLILFIPLYFRAACRQLWMRFTSMPCLLPELQLHWYWLRCVMCRSSLIFPCAYAHVSHFDFGPWSMHEPFQTTGIAMQYVSCVYVVCTVYTYFVAHLFGEVALVGILCMTISAHCVFSPHVCLASCRDLLLVYQDICTEHLWSTASIMYCDRAHWHPLRLLFYHECLTAMCTFQQSLCILYTCPQKSSVHINYMRYMCRTLCMLRDNDVQCFAEVVCEQTIHVHERALRTVSEWYDTGLKCDWTIHTYEAVIEVYMYS